MSAYAYCESRACGAPLDSPSLADAVVGQQVCPRCGSARELDQFERRMAVDYVSEALNKLTQWDTA